jgi:hypothetical protein
MLHHRGVATPLGHHLLWTLSSSCRHLPVAASCTPHCQPGTASCSNCRPTSAQRHRPLMRPYNPPCSVACARACRKRPGRACVMCRSLEAGTRSGKPHACCRHGTGHRSLLVHTSSGALCPNLDCHVPTRISLTASTDIPDGAREDSPPRVTPAVLYSSGALRPPTAFALIAAGPLCQRHPLQSCWVPRYWWTGRRRAPRRERV